MERDLETLIDERNIIDLATQYCWALDRRDFDALHEIFLPDAFAILGETECDGIDAITERISSALTPLDASQHLVGSHEVRVDADRATHRCYLQAQHVRHAADGGPLWMVGGKYEDELRRTSRGWRISRRILSRIWTDGNPNVVAADLRRTR